MRIFILLVVVVAVNATMKSCPKELNCFACIRSGCSYYESGGSRFCSGEKLSATSYNVKIKTMSRCLAVDSAKAKVDGIDTDFSTIATDQTTNFSVENNQKDVSTAQPMSPQQATQLPTEQPKKEEIMLSTQPNFIPSPLLPTQPPAEQHKNVENQARGGELPFDTQKTMDAPPFMNEASKTPGTAEQHENEETPAHAAIDKLPTAIEKPMDAPPFMMEASTTTGTAGLYNEEQARAHWVELQCRNFLAMRRLALIHYKKERELNYDHAMRRCMAMMPSP